MDIVAKICVAIVANNVMIIAIKLAISNTTNATEWPVANNKPGIGYWILIGRNIFK